MGNGQPFERWLVLLVSFSVLCIAFSFGLFSLPVFYPVLARRFGWNHASVAAGGSIVLLLIGGMSPFVGWLADQYRPKRVLLGGMGAVAVSLVLLSTTRTLGEYYAFCVLLGLGAASVSLLPNSLLIAPWFPKARGTAVGIINAGVGLGGFAAPLLTTFLIYRRNAAQAFLFLSLLVAIPLVLTLVLVRSAAPRTTAGGSEEAFSMSAASRQPLGWTARRALFWIFGPVLFFSAHAMIAVQQHLVLYLTGQGVPAARAALALSIALGASAVGKILSGAVADRYSARWAILFSVSCLGGGISALLAVAPGDNLIFLVLVVFGLGFGGIFNAPPLIIFEHFGTERVGTLFGFLMVFFAAGASTGGLVAGLIYDQTHQYSVAFSLDLALSMVALILVLVSRFPARARLAASPATD